MGKKKNGRRDGYHDDTLVPPGHTSLIGDSAGHSLRVGRGGVRTLSVIGPVLGDVGFELIS